MEYGEIKDGPWHLLDYDTATKRSVWWMMDAEGNDLFRHDIPVDDILEANHWFRGEGAGKRWGEGQRIASIPLPLFFDELNEACLQDDKKYVSKWLNNSDNRGWRTFEGRV